jgi:PAS domain-containing protein
LIFADDAVYSDEVELNDGRIFERQSRPQILDEKVIGRVFNFREITEQKRAQKKLRESEEWLKALLDASRDGILVEDDGIIAYVNRAYAEQLKYDAPEELVGKERCRHSAARRSRTLVRIRAAASARRNSAFVLPIHRIVQRQNDR